VTTLREILSYVAESPSKIVPFHNLRARFNGDLTGLKVALADHLLDLRGDCYALTPAGSAFLVRKPVKIVIAEKRCIDCATLKPVSEFWKNTASGDGLFDYCSPCGNHRKKVSMEKRRLEAEQRVRDAGSELVALAAQWDTAVAMLAAVWEGIIRCDTVIREATAPLALDTDSGRMHARTTFPRAAYTLNLALSEARFPQTVPLLREVNFPPKLADYIGLDPIADYGLTLARQADDLETGNTHAEESRAGPPEGLTEQGHQGTEGDDPRGARRRGRAGVSGAQGEGEKPRRVPQARRPVLA
jgi:hypothetical protein